MGSSWTRAQTHVPCTGRQILNHCATREVPTVQYLYILWMQKKKRETEKWMFKMWHTLCFKSKKSLYCKFLMTSIVYVSVEFAVMWDYRNKPYCGQKDGGVRSSRTHCLTGTLTYQQYTVQKAIMRMPRQAQRQEQLQWNGLEKWFHFTYTSPFPKPAELAIERKSPICCFSLGRQRE